MLGLNKRILQVISGMLISFAPVSLSAQVKYANITFQSPDTTDPALKELSINILQQNILMVGPVNTELKVLAGVKMKIEFLSNLISIKGYTDIAIYSDTIIFLGAGDLQPITVRSKKRMVQQTLSGFVYNPQSDSLFRKGNILMALQRLPFFRLEVDAIKYKQGEKVLFMINGKEREGIANWNDVLRNIPAKEIYKVELITDIPLTVENRGYSAIVDLRTADVNLSGSAISAVLTADQRKNLNENIDATFLKNRSVVPAYY
ncbi:MAG: hypothetical protein EOO07_13405 [Chitinophagaceae bacterium]|nr:MAG: hypothetical protein EOO07_13405 [Chitinophagaceae bacterium]